MASKLLTLRMSWHLHELTEELTTHLRYPNKTALIKSLIRYAATVHKDVSHSVTVEQSKKSADAQDEIDKELLRKFRAGETAHRQLIVAAAQNVKSRLPNVPAGFVESFIDELRGEIGKVMEDPAQGRLPF